MATLEKKHKKFIITQLACYEPPSEVIKELREKFGVEVSGSQIAYYDPTNAQGSGLAKKWKKLFHKTREKFIDGTVDIAITHKMYRLKLLDEMAIKLKRMKNYKGVAEMLEQAAKEMGDSYTNKKEHSIQGKLANIDLDRLNDQQLQRIANGENPLSVLANSVQFYLPENGRDQ